MPDKARSKGKIERRRNQERLYIRREPNPNDLLRALIGVSNLASRQPADLVSSNPQSRRHSPHVARSCVMAVTIHVRDALLAALKLAGTIETAQDDG